MFKVLQTIVNKCFGIINLDIRKKYPRPSIKFARIYFKDKPINFIEVGTFKGENAISIINCLKINKGYLIDLWGEYPEYIGMFGEEKNFNRIYYKVINLFKPYKNISIIKNKSEEALKNFKNNTIDLIYIDANHEYSYVKQDIELSWPLLNNGGILAGHDINNASHESIEGVLKAVLEFVNKHNLKLYIDKEDWWVVK